MNLIDTIAVALFRLFGALILILPLAGAPLACHTPRHRPNHDDLDVVKTEIIGLSRRLAKLEREFALWSSTPGCPEEDED